MRVGHVWYMGRKMTLRSYYYTTPPSASLIDVETGEEHYLAPVHHLYVETEQALCSRIPDVGEVFWARLKCCGVDTHDDIEPIFARLADAPDGYESMIGVHRDALGLSPVDARRQILEREADRLARALDEVRRQLEDPS